MSVNLNQGLKPYQEAITHEIGSLKTIVNLCPSASNILVEIPLFKTFGVSVMSPSLIYNYQLRNSGGYIKGVKFSYFPTLYRMVIIFIFIIRTELLIFIMVIMPLILKQIHISFIIIWV